MALGGDADKSDDVRMTVLFQYASLLQEFPLDVFAQVFAARLNRNLLAGQPERSPEDLAKLTLMTERHDERCISPKI